MQVIPYLLVGFPDQIAFLHHLYSFLENPHFPFVEVGLPAQRPYLDGKVIRSAQKWVRKAGMTFRKALQFLEDISWGGRVRKMVLMGYLRDLEEFGLEEFEVKTHDARLGGMVLVGQRRKVLTCQSRLTIPLVPVVTVKDTESTLRPFFQGRPPFIYFRVSSGKTGEGGLLPLPLLEESLRKLRKAYPEIPIFAGFGVRDRETARFLRDIGFSGVVVGSVLLRIMMEDRPMEDFLRELEEL
ncbi:MAG: tryptophan synthase subunit alpha [Atribacterota bacterium]